MITMTVRAAFALVIGLAGSAAAQGVDVPADTLAATTVSIGIGGMPRTGSCASQ
jgi:hypothetical protein